MRIQKNEKKEKMFISLRPIDMADPDIHRRPQKFLGQRHPLKF